MDGVIGYSEFRREQDGRVTVVAHTQAGPQDRVAVIVAVESQITRADGTVEPARTVASSETLAGETGSVRFG